MSGTPQQKTFVYGTFRWPDQPRPVAGKIGAGPLDPDVAIEVLREFGPNEFRGKLYNRLAGVWTPIILDRVRNLDWYLAFQKSPKHFLFDMQYSGAWEVQYFRAESDEAGLYLSVALKLLPDLPPWLALRRRFFES
jgi:hypothetical protein